MEADNVVEEHSSKVRSCGCFVTGNEVAHLSEAINDYEDRIVPLRSGEIGDEVTGDAFPGTGWGWEWSKFTMLEVSRCLAARTEIARGNILRDVRTDTGEIIIA
jgi:hypothetical protein